jgi:hypothetical protein
LLGSTGMNGHLQSKPAGSNPMAWRCAQ